MKLLQLAAVKWNNNNGLNANNKWMDMECFTFRCSGRSKIANDTQLLPQCWLLGPTLQQCITVVKVNLHSCEQLC